MRREPDFTSEVVATLAKGSLAQLVETVERGGKRWNLLRTPAGVAGYVEAVTPVAVVPDPSKSMGWRHVWIAARWLVAALALAALGAALGVRPGGLALMAAVPVVQGVRFAVFGCWNLTAAPV